MEEETNRPAGTHPPIRRLGTRPRMSAPDQVPDHASDQGPAENRSTEEERAPHVRPDLEAAREEARSRAGGDRAGRPRLEPRSRTRLR